MVNWDVQFSELQSFKEDHGHCNVPEDYDANRQLAQWVQINEVCPEMERSKLIDAIDSMVSSLDLSRKMMFGMPISLSCNRPKKSIGTATCQDVTMPIVSWRSGLSPKSRNCAQS